MSKKTQTASAKHPILAIAYVLSRWGETSWGDLEEVCSIEGICRSRCEQAVAKLIELRNLKEENGRLVWIGKPYMGGAD